MSRTSIEWATDSWNPIAFYVPGENGGEKRGWMCTKPSEGCAHCYAAAMNLYRGNGLPYVVSSLDKGEFRLVNIDDPLHWRKPRQVFVCSMTDLFHESIPTPMIDEVIARIAVLALWDRPHIMIVLTKRARRQRDYFNDPGLRERIARVVGRATQAVDAAVAVMSRLAWPLENLWVGCTAENQARLDERMPDLAATLAAHRFLSCEPLLSALEFTPPEHRGTNVNVNDWLGDLDWVVAGGESGAGARPMRSEWVRGIRDACRGRTDMGRPWPLPFHFKQWGNWRGASMRPAGTKGRFAIVDNEYATLCDRYPSQFDAFGASIMEHVGKKKAGRVLDDHTWDARPGALGA